MFLHYFCCAKIQVIGIRLEIKLNEKITETKHSETPINCVNIYFTIKRTASLDISCLWSLGQKILPQAPGQQPYLNTTYEHTGLR